MLTRGAQRVGEELVFVGQEKQEKRSYITILENYFLSYRQSNLLLTLIYGRIDILKKILVDSLNLSSILGSFIWKYSEKITKSISS